MNNARPNYDAEIQAICDYVLDYKVESIEAYKTAYYDFLDTIACGLMALQFKACTKLMGPIVPHATLSPGARVPGTNYELDPAQAAFNIGTMIRWLDFNDTWLAAEWGHPSDNLGSILAICDYLSRCQQRQFTMYDILTAMIKAHEIQGVIALENSFNQRGLDHVVLVKVASTAVVAQLLGLSREEICAAISLAWVDGQSLRTYRHAPNTGTRKSWAAGDATSRAVTLALMVQKGEMGYPSALTAKTWGFYDVYFDGNPFVFQRPYGSYVMEHVLFKISYPAEFHAQTAVEAACILHPLIKDRLDDIERIDIRSHEAALRIIAKSGPLHNPADRDHCLQYMIAIGLLFGDLEAGHYEDAIAANPRIDKLREKMHISESPQFTKDYHDPDKRAISNAIIITFKDGSQTEELIIEYPIGHHRRRKEGIPLLMKKFNTAVTQHYPLEHANKIIKTCDDYQKFLTLTFDAVMKLIVTTPS